MKQTLGIRDIFLKFIHTVFQTSPKLDKGNILEKSYANVYMFLMHYPHTCFEYIIFHKFWTSLGIYYIPKQSHLLFEYNNTRYSHICKFLET